MTPEAQLKALSDHLESVIEEIADKNRINELVSAMKTLTVEIRALREAVEPNLMEIRFVPETLDS